MTDRTCQNRKCGARFTARTADVKRGWGLFCSKSCKANSPKVSPGKRDYLRVQSPAPTKAAQKPARQARQESMYELGLNGPTPGWDDTAWQNNG